MSVRARSVSSSPAHGPFEPACSSSRVATSRERAVIDLWVLVGVLWTCDLGHFAHATWWAALWIFEDVASDPTCNVLLTCADAITGLPDTARIRQPRPSIEGSFLAFSSSLWRTLHNPSLHRDSHGYRGGWSVFFASVHRIRMHVMADSGDHSLVFCGGNVGPLLSSECPLM